jgi:putative Ca2+/H+ antiporter (TMEM165/GDT1 family)
MATLISFFIVEIGDKTQIATSLLAARFHNIPLVTLGTTLGMMLANAPVVLLGDKIIRKIPIALVHRVAAGIFAVLGVLVLLNVGSFV